MPNPGRRIGHFVSDERTAIDSWNRLDCIDGRSSPGIDRRDHSHGGAAGRKSETRGAGDIVPTVRSVVVHVALARMTLAPSVFVRDDVLRFSKIRRSRV